MDLDTDTYYAEQDDRMNMPDETAEAYAERVSKYRLSQENTSYSAPVRMAQNVPSRTAAPVVQARFALSTSTHKGEATNDLERSLKRKASASDHLSANGGTMNEKKPKVSDQDVVFDLPASSPRPEPTPSLDDRKDHSKLAQEDIDEIDSFTVSHIQVPAITRKNESKHSPQRAASIDRVVEHSPISSFSRSINASPPHAAQTRKPMPVIAPNNVPLDLRPIPIVERRAKQPTKNKTESNAYASEEQPSESPSKRNKALTAEHSQLYLEVQERIAKFHGSKKGSSRDKASKLSSKSGKKPKTDSHKDAVNVASSSRRALSPQKLPSTKPIKPKEEDAEVQVVKPPTIEKKPEPLIVWKDEPRGQVTVPEFIKYVMEAAAAAKASMAEETTDSATKGCRDFLKGMNLVYAHWQTVAFVSEIMRDRLKAFAEHGATLMSKFDPAVTTHIVTDYPGHHQTARMLSRRLGLKSEDLSEVPSHIIIFRWAYMVESIKKMHSASREELLADMANFMTYKDRPIVPRPTSHVEAGSSAVLDAGTRTARESDSNSAVGKAAAFGVDAAPVSPPQSQLPQEDPLAEFYEEAERIVALDADDGSSSPDESGVAGKPEAQGFLGRDETDDETDDGTDDDAPVRGKGGAKKKRKQPRGYACDRPFEEQNNGPCPNQDVVDKLTELHKLKQAQLGNDPKWRAFSLNKSIAAIRAYPTRIKSHSEALKIPGVGSKTADKIMEIIQTGNLRRIKYENTEDVQVINLFKGVYNVGNSIAHTWYMAGCRTLDDLRNGKGGVKLTRAQKIGLQYYDDIATRIPREEVKTLFELIKKVALGIDPHLFIEVMGSYRRGQADCGDIDILITRPTDDERDHSGIMFDLMKELHVKRILTDDLVLPKDSYDLHTTYRGLCRLPGVSGALRRRIDILCVPWEARGAALIYYTGDDIFNCSMRLKANRMGYSLNEQGLFKGVIRDPSNRSRKLDKGVLAASETEEEIFKILGVPWKEPHQRALRRR